MFLLAALQRPVGLWLYFSTLKIMSATILAAKIVSEWDELSADSPVNRETYIRNLLIAFQIHVASETVADITKEIAP